MGTTDTSRGEVEDYVVGAQSGRNEETEAALASGQFAFPSLGGSDGKQDPIGPCFTAKRFDQHAEH